jgi:hypothetical protein
LTLPAVPSSESLGTAEVNLNNLKTAGTLQRSSFLLHHQLFAHNPYDDAIPSIMTGLAE